MTPFALRALDAEQHALAFEQRTRNSLAARYARSAGDGFRAAARLVAFSRDRAAHWYRIARRDLRRARYVDARGKWWTDVDERVVEPLASL